MNLSHRKKEKKKINDVVYQNSKLQYKIEVYFVEK